MKFQSFNYISIVDFKLVSKYSNKFFKTYILTSEISLRWVKFDDYMIKKGRKKMMNG